MAAPLLSIITVCRNHRAGLARTHASLAAQRPAEPTGDSGGCAFEWLVQDGGSTDGSRDLLAGLTAPAADCHSEADDRPFDGMNRAMARGAWLLFLNAGDTLAAADTLARFAAILGSDPDADLVYGDA